MSKKTDNRCILQHIPQGRGDKWLFKATGLREYLENEFLEILRR